MKTWIRDNWFRVLLISMIGYAVWVFGHGLQVRHVGRVTLDFTGSTLYLDHHGLGEIDGSTFYLE